ncbi:carnosine N-methyltransferase family protein [Sporobolomyces salmoneus]|uniref:carnosine N-methyltransferase family protein n=1 Tax=Sporobolomyces salmoneus TaxID=183962 RepID=UPI003175E465
MSHSHSHADPSHSHSHGDSTEMSMETDDSQSSQSEGAHQATVVATFDQYRQSSLSANQRRRADYYALPLRHRELLPDFKELLNEVDEKLSENAQFVQLLIDSNPFPPPPDASLSARAPTEADHERLRSTLRQCARDWSETGKKERDSTYTPILQALDRAFEGLTRKEKYEKKVLVPGAGLGRLAWEIVRLGYSCQANEFSLHMLIASSFILNSTTRVNEHAIYPYLHSFSNIRNKEDLLSPCWIPDVDPNEIVPSSEDGTEGGGDFSFAAGDFLELYGNGTGDWDACVTCFFIDTARSIPHYLETIYGLLKPGGVWINCGPTLWHFENDPHSRSIELPLEDVKALARRIGFEFLEERELQTSYTTNPKSLLRHEYTAAFWVAKKP